MNYIRKSAYFLLLGLVLTVSMAAPALAIDTGSAAEIERQYHMSQLRTKTSEPTEKSTPDASTTEKPRVILRQDICEHRQAKINTTLKRLVKQGTHAKKRIDTTYERVAAFYKKSKLTVKDYDAYITAIEAAKANATTSLESIDSQGFTLDCTADGAGEKLDSFRTAVKDARTPIKEYRKAVVSLIRAMKAEQAKANRTTAKVEAGNE